MAVARTIPLGRITLLVGRPGEGKTFVTTDISAGSAPGRPWPDGSVSCPSGSVIFVSAEDDPADTIRPRLNAHHADVRRVHLLSAVRRVAKDGAIHEVMFTLADVGALESALMALPDCKLIVVDPIGSFLGGSTDSHRDNEVRSVLAPWPVWQRSTGVRWWWLPIVAKVRGPAPMISLWALGPSLVSQELCGTSAGTLESPTRRLLLPGKNNLAKEGDGLAFAIEGEPPAIVWESEPVTMSADDALEIENGDGRGSKRGPEPAARIEAEEWLRGQLKAGEIPVVRSGTRPRPHGYAWRTMQRAATPLGLSAGRADLAGAGPGPSRFMMPT